MMGTVIWDASEWSRGHVDLRVRIESTGPLHAFDDRLTLKIDNREREANPDGDFAHQFNYSKASIRGPSNGRFDVKIGGVEAGTIEEPTPQNYRPEQSVPIPITLESGRHDVTVDGHKIGTVRVYNPDYPPPEPPDPTESAPTPDPPTGSSNASGGSGDGNSDPAPSNSPTPDPSGSTDSGSSGGGSSIDSRARAAAIAVMGVVAALIATRS